MRQLFFITFLTLQYALIPAQTIQKLSAEEAPIFLTETNTDSLLIIDGRSDEMYRSGHLKNAINIDAYKESLQEELSGITDYGHLFIYCTKSTRSDSIISTLSRLGYKGEIIQMSDGITAWKAHDFELIVPKTDVMDEDNESQVVSP